MATGGTGGLALQPFRVVSAGAGAIAGSAKELAFPLETYFRQS